MYLTKEETKKILETANHLLVILKHSDEPVEEMNQLEQKQMEHDVEINPKEEIRDIIGAISDQIKIINESLQSVAYLLDELPTYIV